MSPRRSGALFPLVYLVGSLRAMLRGGRAYRDNVFEQEACLRSSEVKAA